MLNAFQSPQSVALIGATSEIGLAILKHLPHDNLERCLVVARDPKRGSTLLKEILPSRTKLVEIGLRAEETGSNKDLVERLFADADLDVAIIAVGTLGNDPELTDDANALNAMNINYVASAHLMLLIADKMRIQGHGRIEIISSFAQTRPRVDNFVYGSTKAGLDFMARGLNEKLLGTGVSVCVLRPGFVHTRMTKLLPPAPFAVKSDVVGKLAVKLLKSDAVVAYAPPILKWVAIVFTLLPASIFRRLSNR